MKPTPRPEVDVPAPRVEIRKDSDPVRGTAAQTPQGSMAGALLICACLLYAGSCQVASAVRVAGEGLAAAVERDARVELERLRLEQLRVECLSERREVAKGGGS